MAQRTRGTATAGGVSADADRRPLRAGLVLATLALGPIVANINTSISNVALPDASPPSASPSRATPWAEPASRTEEGGTAGAGPGTS